MSYSCNDTTHPFVERVRRYFKRDDVQAYAECFLAEDRNDVGEDFLVKVRRALDRTRVFLPVLTGHSVGSIWVNQEIGFAQARGLPILPVFDRSTVRYLSGMIQTLDACPLDDRAKVDALFGRVETLLRTQATSSSAITVEVIGIWWSAFDGAFPMYLACEITHSGTQADVVKRVYVECEGRTYEAEDGEKLGRLDGPDFKRVTLKFYPVANNRPTRIRLVVQTVRKHSGEITFTANPLNGWWPNEVWERFTPY